MSRLPGPQGITDPWCSNPGASPPLSYTYTPSPAGLNQAPRAPDELTPIARWMAQEMLRNANGEDAQRILSLNSYSFETCVAETREWPLWQQLIAGSQWQESCLNRAVSTKTAAFIAWGMLVRQDGPWDHKPIIARRFTPAVDTGEQHYHRYHDLVYFYDVWSNIHYGYVGRACGFTESELLDGAGLEQIASDLVRGQRPAASAEVSGLRRFDHAHDRIAVDLGAKLYGLPPECLSAAEVVSRIFANRGYLITRDYPQ